MLKSRLIEVLKTFSKKEFRELNKWMHSPFHNQRKDVLNLCLYLSDEKVLLEDESLAKETVFPHIYPDEVYDDAKIRQVMYFLFKEVEDFLIYNEYQKDALQSKILLSKVYRKRKLEKNFTKVRKNIEAIISNENLDEKAIYNAFLFQNELYEYHVSTKRTQELNLKKLSETFDVAFITEKLNQACITSSHKAIYKTEYSSELVEFIDSYIQEHPELLETPILALYYYAYKTLSTKKGEQFFYDFKEKLNDNSTRFPKIKMRDFYTIAINFCIKKFNTGHKPFISEAWDLYKQGIENEILLIRKILNHYTYTNFISFGLILKYYKEVEKYIYKYGELLNEKYRENYINFNLVRLYFEKGNYEKAMELVGEYEFKDVLMNVRAKIILLKIYYELSEFRALESLLESLRAYIQRKKELDLFRRNLYKNIIRYTKKLLKVNPYSKAQKEKLRAEIEMAQPLTEKTWLLKQLDAL